MRKVQNLEQARELANGLISFVSHRFTDAQVAVKQWMPSEQDPRVGTHDSCRWSFHQLGHVIAALAMGDVDAVGSHSKEGTGTIRLSRSASCNPLNPNREKWIEERAELEKRLAILMGGRAAEALFFDDVSTLSSEDLREATEIARAMVMKYGMSSSLGLVSFLTPADHVFRGHSDATARLIDHEVQGLLDRAFSKACERLEFARPFLEKSVERLQRQGSVNPDQIRLRWREFESHALKTAPKTEAKGTETVLMH